MALLLGLIRRSTELKEGFRALYLVIPGGDHECTLACLIDRFRVGTLFQFLSQLCNIPLVEGGPEGGLMRPHLRAFAQLVGDPYQRDDNDSAHNEWQKNALDAMEKQGAKTFPLPQHGSEISTDQEKEGHAEPVNGLISPFIGFMLSQVLGRPVSIGEKREKTMHHDSKEHGGGPQGIEVVVTRGPDHGGILHWCYVRGQEGSRESSLDTSLREPCR